MYFRYFVIISPSKRAGPFNWTNLNPLHPRMHCAKFGWNWPSGSGEEYFLISSMYFSYFVSISPWKRAGSFICAKFGWNWPSGSGDEYENVKRLRQRHDNDGQRTNFDQKSSLYTKQDGTHKHDVLSVYNWDIIFFDLFLITLAKTTALYSYKTNPSFYRVHEICDQSDLTILRY